MLHVMIDVTISCAEERVLIQSGLQTDCGHYRDTCASVFENVGHDVSCQVLIAGEYFWKHSGAALTICAYV